MLTEVELALNTHTYIYIIYDRSTRELNIEYPHFQSLSAGVYTGEPHNSQLTTLITHVNSPNQPLLNIHGKNTCNQQG